MALRFQQKLIVPSASRPLIDRPQLIAQLEQAISSKRVIALAAPAGWGKTTALAQWASRSAIPAAWYTLDSADRDPQLFLDYLLHSVADFVPAAPSVVAQLAECTPQGLAEVTQRVALAFADAPRAFALVLDDFHVLDDEQPAALPGSSLVLDLLASIAEYAPRCRLVFSSRTLPALHGLVRMVAQQRAAVFDYSALQLSSSETQRLAGVTAGLTLSDEVADQLTARLGGWVTGIVLSLDQATLEHGAPPVADAWSHGAALATQREVLVQADTSQVYAYFAEQIVAPLAPELQAFLEDTSILEDLSPQRCDTLRARDDSTGFLDAVKRRGLFVSSRAGWLAYHSLFRDYLRARLARDPQRRRALLRAAGDLYRAEDDVERALDCYLMAGADAAAVDLLRSAVPRLRQRSRQTTLLACFERFAPGSGSATHGEPGAWLGRTLPPDLLLAQARVYSDLALWERAHLAIQLAETLGDDALRQEARILFADLLVMQGDPARAQAALDEIDAERLAPRLQLAYHITSGRTRIVTGEVSAAVQALEQAHALAPAMSDSDDPSSLADIYDNLGWAYATQGDRQAAIRYLKRADACWQASGNSGRRALTLNNLGITVLEEGRYAEARAAFDDGLAIARQTGRRREETVLRCSMAELDLLEGELEQAVARYTEAHALAVRLDVASSVDAAAAGALWAAALSGDAALAQAWNDVTTAIVAPTQPEVRGRLALGRALIALQQPRPDLGYIGGLAAEATAQEAYLSEPERAYAALLRAELTFARSGWHRAAAEWSAWIARAQQLPEALLLRFAGMHRALFEAAAPHTPLAQRLIETLARPAPTRWQINALGTFGCLVDGVPADLSPLHRALLVRLLDAGPQGLAVDRLWEAVWGDSEVSMPALHQALRRLRVQTGLAASARDGSVAIRSPWQAIEYDVRTLEQALDTPGQREAIQRAVTLYRGEFLPGAPLSAALWTDTRRAHLQQRYLDALEQHAHAIERESPQQAIHFYQLVLQIDGCREHTAAQLMRLAARFGNRTLVAATFEHLKGALRALGTTPEPATAALFQQLH